MTEARPRFPFLSFVAATAREMVRGSMSYHLWVLFLIAWIVAGAVAYAHQLDVGFAATNLTDHVPWGAYIANFTYLVGMAAAAVMLVIPAYILYDHSLKEVVVFGEQLAIAVMIMCMLFVTVDLGRPERAWHLIPILGHFNWPRSMLSWDVIVLLGYLLLNAHITSYLVFSKFCGREPDRRKYLPFVFVAIFWAISIHTVTAFLYSGLGARHHWNTAVLAPRFLASAFAAGPALMIVALTLIRDRTGFPVKGRALDRLRQILFVSLLINLFLFGSEVFTELYAGTHSGSSIRYLLFGLHGHDMLVPYIWAAMALEAFAVAVLLSRRLFQRSGLLLAACIATVLGVWVEKGMGLVVPGFVPSPLGEIVEYSPSVVEFFVSAGIWAAGALVFTLLVKATVPIELGRLKLAGAKEDA